jgi:hypothetical protein
MAKPTHKAYTIREFEIEGKKKGDWMEIGVAFAHSDNKGFDVRLQAVPVDGKVTLRLNEPRTAADDQTAAPEQA